MNKAKFIEELEAKTYYDKEKCKIINDVIQSHLIVGKNNKEKIINDFINSLDIDREEADSLYDSCVFILGKEIKNKIRHPFKSKDK